METPEWIIHLRSSPSAWADYLMWLETQRQYVLEETSKTWDEEKTRQGKKIMLDIIKNLSTLDQKTRSALDRINGARQNG